MFCNTYKIIFWYYTLVITNVISYQISISYYKSNRFFFLSPLFYNVISVVNKISWQIFKAAYS